MGSPFFIISGSNITILHDKKDVGRDVSNALILSDESGDLGWKLDQPNRDGGSSRYFVIAACLGANGDHMKFGKVVRKLWEAKGWTSKNEKKWIDLKEGARSDFCILASKMLSQNRETAKLFVSVIKKELIPLHMRDHFHLIYAMAFSRSVYEEISRYRNVSLCPDNLNAGTGSKGLIENITRRDVWLQGNGSTTIDQIHRSKPLEDGLAFCDYIAGAVWNHYEEGRSDAFSRLSGHMHVHEMWGRRRDPGTGEDNPYLKLA